MRRGFPHLPWILHGEIGAGQSEIRSDCGSKATGAGAYRTLNGPLSLVAKNNTSSKYRCCRTL